MAISIPYGPTGVQPVYQPFFFRAQSTNYLQPQFRFLFDVYKDGTFIERIKMLPQPGTDIAEFSPARVLESYLSYDLTNTSTFQTNCIAHYAVKVGEEYGPITAPPVLYTNLAQRSGYTFNGTVQYQDYYNAAGGAEFDDYLLKIRFLFPNNGKFLTNAPTGVTIGTNERRYLSVFNFDSTDGDVDVKKATFLVINTYQNTGGSIANIYYYQGNSATTIAFKGLHFPAGPANINQISYASFVAGVYPSINTSTDYAYDITLFNGGPALDSQISETRYYEFEECSKYDRVRIMFLNRLGQFDYFSFDLVSRDFITSEKTTFKKNLPISYYFGTTAGNREKTVLNSMNQKTKKVTSNWVDDETSTWLEELWTSPEVYEIINPGLSEQYLPIIIKTASYEIKKRINDQIYNYEMEYEYSSEVNTQRN
jgi:hypothetical protein